MKVSAKSPFPGVLLFKILRVLGHLVISTYLFLGNFFVDIVSSARLALNDRAMGSKTTICARELVSSFFCGLISGKDQNNLACFAKPTFFYHHLVLVYHQ